VLTAVWCIGTPPRDVDDGFLPRRRLPPLTTVATFLDSDGFFCSTATTASHLFAWPMVASSSLNAWIWPWLARIWVVDFFIFKKRFLLLVGNNRYHKEDVFCIGQIVSVVSTNTIKVLLTDTTRGFCSSVGTSLCYY
jgi:hypothetical protein